TNPHRRTDAITPTHKRHHRNRRWAASPPPAVLRKIAQEPIRLNLISIRFIHDNKTLTSRLFVQILVGSLALAAHGAATLRPRSRAEHCQRALAARRARHGTRLVGEGRRTVDELGPTTLRSIDPIGTEGLRSWLGRT